MNRMWSSVLVGTLVCLPSTGFAQSVRTRLTQVQETSDAKPFLGVYPTDTADGLGVRIGDVVENSAAVKAGLQAGDVVVAIAGEEVENSADLLRILGKQKVGAKVKVTFMRDGERRRTSAVLGTAPADGEVEEIEEVEELEEAELAIIEWEPGDGGVVIEPGGGWMGVSITDSDEGGAEVVEVISGSPAEKAGLQVGDVITSVDGNDTGGIGALVETVGARAPGKKVGVSFLRDGKRHKTQVTLGQRDAVVATLEAPDVKIEAPNVRFGQLRRAAAPEQDDRVADLRAELDRMHAEIAELRAVIRQQRAALERIRQAIDHQRGDDDDDDDDDGDGDDDDEDDHHPGWSPNVVFSTSSEPMIATQWKSNDDGTHVIDLDGKLATFSTGGSVGGACCEDCTGCCASVAVVSGDAAASGHHVVSAGEHQVVIRSRPDPKGVETKGYRIYVHDGETTSEILSDGKWITADEFPAAVTAVVRKADGQNVECTIECEVTTECCTDASEGVQGIVTGDGHKVKIVKKSKAKQN